MHFIAGGIAGPITLYMIGYWLLWLVAYVKADKSEKGSNED